MWGRQDDGLLQHQVLNGEVIHVKEAREVRHEDMVSG